MTKSEKIKAEFVEYIPSGPREGMLYISNKYKTATHLCACGCRNKVVTPLKPGGWTATGTPDRITLYPSIGNWSFPCKSHYWVRDGQIVWARKWSQEEIDQVRKSDQHAREEHFDAPRESLWRRILRVLFG
jgi:Family of unknown function (DUF6527)